MMELNTHLASRDKMLTLPMVVSATSKSVHDDDFIARSNVEDDLKSNDLDEYPNSEGSHEFLQMKNLRRSHSLGNLEDVEGASSGGDANEDSALWDCNCAYYDMEKNNGVNSEELEVSEVKFYRHHDHSAEEPHNQFCEPDHQEDYSSSVGTNERIAGDHYDDTNVQSSDEVCSRELSVSIRPRLSKSRSFSSLEIIISDVDGTLDFKSMGFRKSRSVGNFLFMKNKKFSSVDCYESNFSILELNKSELQKQRSVCLEEFDEYYPLSNGTVDSNEEVEPHFVHDQAKGKELCREISKEDKSDCNSDIPRYNEESLSLMIPEIVGADFEKELPDEVSLYEYESQLTSEEFNIKRIHEWINQIDIQSENVVEELGESSKPPHPHTKHLKRPASIMTTKGLEAISNVGMEMAYNYISALNPSSSSAKMANMGLFAIPSLSAFVCLKELNLSCNSIVRITAGSLPKGLHVLNISKNNIAAIEGLKELTRLRVLDLSYNKISRIGHGLAGCSSLRELYLAGNKISEVEGLHRLLKLNILDLSSNKIATSKGLGQLAANYASLQVINLEGNPAQKNIGDEQLKKSLLNILPYLVSYNKKVIRATGSKEVKANRPARSHSSHLSDRTLRSEHKRSHRAATSTTSHKSSHSRVPSSNALSSLLKSSKSRHRRPLPPVVTKPTDQVAKSSLKLPTFPTSSLMRRIRSEEALLSSF